MTPKHFIRNHIQDGPMHHYLGPKGKLNDTIQAMLELWLARNFQWRQKYGAREAALENWREEAYPDSPEFNLIPKSAFPDGVMPKAGEMVMVPETVPTQIVKMERGEHHFVATFSKLHPFDVEGRTPYGVCVEKVELCHPECEVAKAYFELKLKDGEFRLLFEIYNERD